MRLIPVPLSVISRWIRRRTMIHYPRFSRKWLSKASNPEVILIELTNDCNQSCPFCSRDVMKRSVGYMPISTFYSIVDQAKAIPNILIRVVGLGEASMHPQFKDAINYATSSGIPIEITSNGHIFEVMEPEELIQSSIVMLSISIDGFGDGSYEKLRVGGNYQKLRSNVKKFYDKRTKFNRGPYFTLRNVLLGKTDEKRAEQASRFKQEWYGYCDRMSFNDYIPVRLEKVNEGVPRICDDILYNIHIEW